MSRKIIRFLPPQPPSLDQMPVINASSRAAQWLDHYWRKLDLPVEQASYLAVTDDRREFARWTGRRLNTMALGCYCFLPLIPDDDETVRQPDFSLAANLTGPANAPTRTQPTLPGFSDDADNTDLSAGIDDSFAEVYERTRAEGAQQTPQGDYRHLIFIEPELLPEGIEVTIAHELIHLADRISGHPRKHHCHGHDSISIDEAAITERDPEWLRELLAEETRRREDAVRTARPYKHIYVCPNCGKEYPRVRKYSRAVSCGHCDHRFNAAFLLQLRPLGSQGPTGGHDRADHEVARP
jgi:DNA-directed RNA polymerase subunit RPC12/RpoP